MIIAHFFTRSIRKKPYLYVETTSSDGLEQPAPAATRLMPLDLSTDRKRWIRDAYYEFVKRYPGLVLLDPMNNQMRLDSDHPAFDLVFVPEVKKSRTEVLGLEKEKENGVVQSEIQDGAVRRP